MRSVSKNNLSLKILHTNIRGYNSKRISLETIVKTNDIDIVTINETHLKGKKKAEIPGFESFSRNWWDRYLCEKHTCKRYSFNV